MYSSLLEHYENVRVTSFKFRCFTVKAVLAALAVLGNARVASVSPVLHDERSVRPRYFFAVIRPTLKAFQEIILPPHQSH